MSRRTRHRGREWLKRRIQRDVPFFETLWTAILLVLTSGFLDAYTYQLRGHVFANAQTGNLVIMSIRAAQGRFLDALHSLIPIVAYTMGILLTELVKRRKPLRWLPWQHLALLLEILLIIVIGFLPASVPNSVVTVTVSFICAVQADSFASLHGAAYVSTTCTGNLRTGTRYLFQFLTQRNRESGLQAIRYFASIAFFCCGVALGVLFCALWQEKSIWICCIPLLTLFVYSLIIHQRYGRPLDS